MKRDIDLIRKILKTVENSDDAYVKIKTIPGYESEDNTVIYHLSLLFEAGLIDADVETDDDGVECFCGNVWLTWNGHEFLDAAKNEMVWSKAKSILKDRGVVLPFRLFQSLLFKLIDMEVFPE